MTTMTTMSGTVMDTSEVVERAGDIRRDEDMEAAMMSTTTSTTTTMITTTLVIITTITTTDCVRTLVNMSIKQVLARRRRGLYLHRKLRSNHLRFSLRRNLHQ